MKEAISLLGRSESLFEMTSNTVYQLPSEPSRQEEFENLVMNFILDQEEKVKKLEEYMDVIGSDFMQLSLEVVGKLKDEIRMEKNRVKKIEKITTYPYTEGLEPLNDYDPKRHYGFKPGLLGKSVSLGVDISNWEMFNDDWGLKSKEVSPLGEELSLFDRPNEGIWRKYTYLAFGRHFMEIHVTWAHLEKKRTRLRTYTNISQEVLLRSWRRHHRLHVTPSQPISRRRHKILRRRQIVRPSLLSRIFYS
ncbi:hypothetical protein Tco_1516940 [Tanacetum coccineum]